VWQGFGTSLDGDDWTTGVGFRFQKKDLAIDLLQYSGTAVGTGFDDVASATGVGNAVQATGCGVGLRLQNGDLEIVIRQYNFETAGDFLSIIYCR